MSGALILPDSQGRIVDTYMKTKAAAPAGHSVPSILVVASASQTELLNGESELVKCATVLYWDITLYTVGFSVYGTSANKAQSLPTVILMILFLLFKLVL